MMLTKADIEYIQLHYQTIEESITKGEYLHGQKLLLPSGSYTWDEIIEWSKHGHLIGSELGRTIIGGK